MLNRFYFFYSFLENNEMAILQGSEIFKEIFMLFNLNDPRYNYGKYFNKFSINNVTFENFIFAK